MLETDLLREHQPLEPVEDLLAELLEDVDDVNELHWEEGGVLVCAEEFEALDHLANGTHLITTGH